jgi:Protein of unknown function (DUF3489)
MSKQRPKATGARRKRYRDKRPMSLPASRAKSHKRESKTAACLALLERAEGATIAELQKTTGWQVHSLRGFLAGTVKKKLGLNLTSTREARGRVYRIPTKPNAT